MSIRTFSAGACLRALSCGFGFCLLLHPGAAWAFRLGDLHMESAPGQPYSAYVHVALDSGENLEYLIVEAVAQEQSTVPGDYKAIPLQVQLVNSPDSRIRLLGSGPLNAGARIKLDASMGEVHVAQVYFLPPAVPPSGYVPVAQAIPPPATPPSPAAYGEPHREGIFIRPELEGGYEEGGDKLVEVECTETYSNNSVSNSTPGLRAGSGFLVGGGFHVRPYRQSPYDLRLSFDYKYDSACNSVNLQRFRFTLLPTYRFGPRHAWWAGGGLIYETGIRFDGKNLPVAGTDEVLGTLNLNNAVGGTIQIGWRFLALDYNFLKYSSNGVSANADNIGLLFIWGFDGFH